MKNNPIPENETGRLAALKNYKILDTQNEKEFDRLVELASLICDVPISLVSLIDENRKWIKAKVGIDSEQTPRDISFCQHAIMTDDLFEVENATKDERFKNNPLVNGDLAIKFYAGYPLKDPQGHNLGALCAIDRVPKKLNKKKSQALKLLAEEVVSQIISRKNNFENKKLERLFIMSTDMICLAGTDGFFKRINPAFTDTLGWTEEELLGCSFFNFIHKDDVSLTRIEIGKLAKGENTIDFKNRFVKKDGESVHLSWVANSDPTTGELFAIARDITNNLIQLKEINQAKRLAENALLVKDEFLANISHEIRTPLNAIIGFNNLLSETPLNERQKEYVETVSAASQNLMVIINDLLDTSKLESSKLTLEEKRINIKQIAEKVIKFQSNSAKSKGLKLMLTIDHEIPNYVIGDETRLIQILNNLISNSIKFTENGKVELQLLLKGTTHENAEVLFVIKDTGIGIDEKLFDKIFERFSQAESSTTRMYGGTGLGLNIVKMLVELFKGKIDIKSEVNKGTEINFLIPFAISEEKNKINNNISHNNYAIHNIKVLLVEDNEHNQILANHYLKKHKVQVELAINGKIAVELLKTKQFDIIIMDLQMPVMDGYMATKLIRNELKLKTPIIAFSAHSMVGEKEKCLEIGMNEYISKPFTEKELIETIIELISDHVISEKNGNEKKAIGIPNDQLDDFIGILKHIENKEGKEFILAMMNVYLKRIAVDVIEIKDALEDGNLKFIEQKAHLLAGSLGSVSFLKGNILAKKLQSASILEKTEDVEILTKQLIDYLNNSIISIKKYCES